MGRGAYFKSEDAAWKYVIRGDHLRPMKKDIKTYVEGVEIPKPKATRENDGGNYPTKDHGAIQVPLLCLRERARLRLRGSSIGASCRDQRAGKAAGQIKNVSKNNSRVT